MTDDIGRIVHLRTQYPEGLIGVGADDVLLSWQIEAPDRRHQTRSRVQVARSSAFDDVLCDEVLDGHGQVAVRAPGAPVSSRERRFYRVRAELDGEWTSWSDPCTVEVGLIEADDWEGCAITLPDDPGATQQAPAPILRQEFELSGPVARARIHATALGVYELAINGAPVADDLFAPGWSTYSKRLVSQTYDVGHLLTPGVNVISGVIADGWYRGRLGWEPGRDRCRYGDRLGLLAQLEIDLVDGSRQRVLTDEDWRVSTGSIRSADIYDGCTIDLRREPEGWTSAGFDDRDWQSAVSTVIDAEIITPHVSAPIRTVEVRDVEWSVAPNGAMRVDVGQNISGHLVVEVDGLAGTAVRLRHAEVVEPSGELHLLALRTAEATDDFVLGHDGVTALEPRFTFHGFRYADIETDAEILGVRAVAISSDLNTRGSFTCSHPGLVQLESNVRWSQRDNFVGVPTDCPQRDERLGWTGDAQVFSSTANVLFDSHQFWVNWYRDLSLDQTDEGVPSVVPDVVLGGSIRTGRAGFADASTIGPWADYEAYGTVALLEQQLDSMVRWVRTQSSKRGDDGFLGGEFQFGDWLDPDAPSGQPWKAKVDPDFVTNAFFSHSARLTGAAAGLLGRTELASRHHELADEVAARTWGRWAEHAISTQSGCAMAIELGIAPDDERGTVADHLESLVLDAEGAVSSGFFGTRLVLPALARHDRFEAAYTMLLRRDVRSWLYQVDNGATTVWERWDAIRPDGSIHDGRMVPILPRDDDQDAHMLSFNHYAYGSVVDWMYRHVGGLAPDLADPGYRTVVISPQPCDQITSATTKVQTGFGGVEVDWSTDGGRLRVRASLPFGTTGRFVAPVSASSEVVHDGVVAGAVVEVGHGDHEFEVSAPRIIATPPSASG